MSGGRKIGIIATIIILALVGIFVRPKFLHVPEQIFCTQEAKQCSDGSYVGRVAPSCEFAQCPSKATKTPEAAKKLILIPNVPFTPQAPFGDWSDPKQQAGCEEASALMAMRWVSGERLALADAEREIIAIADYEQSAYGEFHDLSAQDFVDRIFKGYFNYDSAEARYDVRKEDIIRELSKGDLVLVPTNGRKLNNPYYTPPGPLQHMLVIRGYDPAAKEFITNDPGTKRGELFRYPENVVMDAIYEYPTGNREPVSEIRKVMVVVGPKTQ